MNRATTKHPMLLMPMPEPQSWILPIRTSRHDWPCSEVAVPPAQVNRVLRFLRTSIHKHTRTALVCPQDLNGVDLRPPTNTHNHHPSILEELMTGPGVSPGFNKVLHKAMDTTVVKACVRRPRGLLVHVKSPLAPLTRLVRRPQGKCSHHRLRCNHRSPECILLALKLYPRYPCKIVLRHMGRSALRRP